MFSNFKEQAIEFVKQAVQEDNAGNYARAFPLYMNALEYFKTHLKYEKNPDVREAITRKFDEYLRRAEELRAVLDCGGVAARPATSPKDGGGASGEGLEGDKKVEVEEKQATVSSNFIGQAIEYVKQAVQEDNAGNYARAFSLYMKALEYFRTHLKYEKNPKVREAIARKFDEYLCRAKELRAALDEGGPGRGCNGDAAVAPRSKTKPEDGGGGCGGQDGEDPELAKLT